MCDNEVIATQDGDEHSCKSIIIWTIVVDAVLVSELHVILQRNQNSPRSKFPLAPVTQVGTNNARQKYREQNADVTQREISHHGTFRTRKCCLVASDRRAIWT